jgi:hypothetical protein
MAWNFRRSIRLGPLRVNLSRSGIGYSVGTRGVRVGRDARRRTYEQISIPKTGIYRRSYGKSSVLISRPVLLSVLIAVLLIYFLIEHLG